jgi:hypothetical protein
MFFKRASTDHNCALRGSFPIDRGKQANDHMVYLKKRNQRQKFRSELMVFDNQSEATTQSTAPIDGSTAQPISSEQVYSKPPNSNGQKQRQQTSSDCCASVPVNGDLTINMDDGATPKVAVSVPAPDSQNDQLKQLEQQNAQLRQQLGAEGPCTTAAYQARGRQNQALYPQFQDYEPAYYPPKHHWWQTVFHDIGVCAGAFARGFVMGGYGYPYNYNYSYPYNSSYYAESQWGMQNPWALQNQQNPWALQNQQNPWALQNQQLAIANPQYAAWLAQQRAAANPALASLNTGAYYSLQSQQLYNQSAIANPQYQAYQLWLAQQQAALNPALAWNSGAYAGSAYAYRPTISMATPNFALTATPGF